MNNRNLKHQIMIVEDDESLREALNDTLQMAGYDVVEASDGNMALALLADNDVNMVISDVQMSGMDGHQLLRETKNKFSEIPVVLMTAFGTIQKAVEAMHDGAVDYLVKPFEAEVLINTIADYLPSDELFDGSLIAEDPKTIEMLKLTQRVAQSDATVMICGESGTGKEVFAKEIHRSSVRNKMPFIAINCAAIPENMLEAMLFGYEKGAFTGAYKSSPGKFEQANGGSLLLDEISEMDLALQAKLLRVLQEREVERLGGSKTIPLDVRVIATTNREMKREVKEGRFREDLYYRLNVFPIMLPALRDRPGDIVPIAMHLIRRHLEASNRVVPKMDQSAQTMLRNYVWPGNVRELDNVVQRAIILQTNNAIGAQHIMFEQSISDEITDQKLSQPVTSSVNDQSNTLDSNLKSQEFNLIVEALKESNGSRKNASEKLGVSQRTLRYKMARMRECGIEIPKAYGIND